MLLNILLSGFLLGETTAPQASFLQTVKCKKIYCTYLHNSFPLKLMRKQFYNIFPSVMSPRLFHPCCFCHIQYRKANSAYECLKIPATYDV